MPDAACVLNGVEISELELRWELKETASKIWLTTWSHPGDLQATVAADYQGRVLSLMVSLAGATAPLGLLLAAPITEMLGVRSWYMTGGSVCLAMGTAGFFLPSLMQIEQPPGR